jgi:hypothetical protein
VNVTVPDCAPDVFDAAFRVSGFGVSPDVVELPVVKTGTVNALNEAVPTGEIVMYPCGLLPYPARFTETLTLVLAVPDPGVTVIQEHVGQGTAENCTAPMVLLICRICVPELPMVTGTYSGFGFADTPVVVVPVTP